MKILVYPIGKNPYQNLLYNKLRNNKDIQIKYLKNKFIDTNHAFTIGMPIFPLRFLYLRLRGWNIIHLHWLSPFVLPSKNKFLKIISTAYIIIFIIYIKMLKFKLVWTMHETLPHEKEFYNDKKIRIILSRLSDAIIIHSSSILKEAIQLGFNIKNTHIIPHGNYTTAYKNIITRKKARKKLGLKNNDFVFLFFGMIKPYKGINKLLETFEKILKTNNKIKLIIAGNCMDKKLNKIISIYASKYKKNIKIYLKYIENYDVQNYFNASDVIVLPFKRNTTSGSAILSMGFGKPIIAPLLGSIKDLPTNAGLFYKYIPRNGLLKCMIKAINNKNKLKKAGKNGLNYSKSLTWDKSALLTKNVFVNLFIKK